jgi:hypothetical protein
LGQLLRVLAGQATSLLVENEAALAQGAEFTPRGPDGGVELHQVKRQCGSTLAMREFAPVPRLTTAIVNDRRDADLAE